MDAESSKPGLVAATKTAQGVQEAGLSVVRAWLAIEVADTYLSAQGNSWAEYYGPECPLLLSLA